MDNWRTDLKFFKSGEWDVIQEKLHALDRSRVVHNPGWSKLFSALDACPPTNIRVAILGQDPYPTHSHCTGLAFSVPDLVNPLSPTLTNIFNEYCRDLHYPRPLTGSLQKWVNQGVLLWNVIPSCAAGRSLSHKWTEWSYLTKEIIGELERRAVPMVTLGGVAREYTTSVDQRRCTVLNYSHPSPRASAASRNPFFGSRMFTTINDHLTQQGLEPVDWRL